MRSHVRRLKGAANTVLCLAAVAASSQAHAELGYGVDVGVGHSDNIERTSTAPKDETIATVGGDVSLEHKSNRLNVSLDGSAQYLDYLDGTYDSDVIGGVVARTALDIIRERFSWMLDDTFGQGTIDPLSTPSPGNRENINYLTTGPNFTLPLTSRVHLRLSGRYSDVYYETSDLGNERLEGSAALARQVSESSTASINVTSEEVDYKGDEEFADFERREAYFRYEMAGARTALGLSVGYTELEQKLDQDSLAARNRQTDGLLMRANLSRRVSPSMTVGFDAGREFSDAGNIFRQLQTDAPGSIQTQPVQQLATPFTNTYGTLRWDFQGHRTDIQVRTSYFDEAYEGVAALADRQRLEGQVNVLRNLSSATSVYLQGTYSKQDYKHIDQEFSEVFATAVFQWQLGRMTALSMQYLRYDRSGDVSENQLWVRFRLFGGDGQRADSMSSQF